LKEENDILVERERVIENKLNDIFIVEECYEEKLDE
jgi:hypothetical protein